VVLVGCNPIILIWGLGGEHNDSLMLLFVVLAAYLLLRAPDEPRASMRAGVALVTAVFIKASAAVLLPIFLLAGQRRRFLAGALATGGALALASAIAFGANLPGLSTQSRVVTTVGLPNLLALALAPRAGGDTRARRVPAAHFRPRRVDARGSDPLQARSHQAGDGPPPRNRTAGALMCAPDTRPSRAFTASVGLRAR
jgi:4-amino-4-deoxy-L-arabinose transferase-like glycosyltransferase